MSMSHDYEKQLYKTKYLNKKLDFKFQIINKTKYEIKFRKV